MAEVAEQAEAVRAEYARTSSAIEADQRLTPEAKAKMRAEAREQANGRLRAIHEATEASIARERANLERRLMSPPALGVAATTSDKIARDASYRDAVERARRVAADPGALVELLELAESTGDDLQARAILAVGLQRGHAHVVNRYTSTRRAEEQAVDRLYELLQAQSNVKAVVARAMQLTGV